jgi:uncharacterized membrane protein YfcA
MSGLGWAIFGLLVIIVGLAVAAWLMNMPIVLIVAGVAIALLIVFLLVTRKSGRTRPVSGPAEPRPAPATPAGTAAGSPQEND